MKSSLIGKAVGEIRKTLKNLQVPVNTKLLVCCSGGQDSLSLLTILNIISKNKNFKYELHVAHINHGLREESYEEEKFIKKYCDDLKISCTVKHLNLKKPCSAAFAREKRYNAFLDIANTIGTKYIVLAHTQTDKIETILMNIIRGCGISGLEGIKPFKKLENGLNLIRPFLNISRDETKKICEKLKLSYVSDKTNDDDSHLRVNLRKNIIPKFPGLENSLLSLSDQALDINEYIKSQEISSFSYEGNNYGYKFNESDCKNPSKILIINSLRKILKKEGIEIEHIKYSIYSDIYNALISKAQKEWYIKPDSILKINKSFLIIEKLKNR